MIDVAAEENAAIVGEEQGTQDIVTAMQTHSSNAALLESACAALWTLSVEGTAAAWPGPPHTRRRDGGPDQRPGRRGADGARDLGAQDGSSRTRDGWQLTVEQNAKLVKQAAIALSSLVIDGVCRPIPATTDLRQRTVRSIW